MNLTTQLRSQHARILSMVSELESMISDGAPALNAAEWHPKVCHLMGWVLVHLEFAQTELYPSLDDIEALKIGAEISRILPMMSRFEARFRHRQEIAGHPGDFLAQMTQICQCLRERIDREQQLVYPLTNRRPFLPVNRLAYMNAPASSTRH
ncbi:MAG: hypothetical protein QM766_13465 [Burkholderiaceae bacterium]